MNKYKFSDLLLYEEKLKNLLQKYGLNYNPQGRTSQYFSYLKRMEKARILDKEKFSRLLQENKARFYYSQFYVLEICIIIDAIESSPQDERIVKRKLKDLLKGTYLLSEETSNNTKARDTTFELSLFSFFNSRSLAVELGDPNPDLKLTTNNFTYNIECKRPNSAGSLETNIRRAVNQLKETGNSKGIPAIALSLEQVLLGDELILHSYDEQSAMNYLNILLTTFAQENLPVIQKRYPDDSFVILYYLSMLCGFATDVPMSYTTYIIGNVYNFGGELSNRIYGDLQPMVSAQNIGGE